MSGSAARTGTGTGTVAVTSDFGTGVSSGTRIVTEFVQGNQITLGNLGASESASSTATGTGTVAITSDFGTGVSSGTGIVTEFVQGNQITLGTLDESDTFIQFLGGSTPESTVVYNESQNGSWSSASSSPTQYDVGSLGTGIFMVGDFRQGFDSLYLAPGVSVISETQSGGSTTLNLSDNGHVVLMPALT